LQRGQTTLLNQRMSQAAQPDFWLLIFFVIECERVSGFFSSSVIQPRTGIYLSRFVVHPAILGTSTEGMILLGA